MIKGNILVRGDIIKVCRKKQSGESYFAGLGGILLKAKTGQDIKEQFNFLDPESRRVLVCYLYKYFGCGTIAKMIDRNEMRVRILIGKKDNRGSAKSKEKRRSYWSNHKHTVQRDGNIRVWTQETENAPNP